MGGLTVDPLALGALAGFAVLILLFIGLSAWFIRQAMKAPGE